MAYTQNYCIIYKKSQLPTVLISTLDSTNSGNQQVLSSSDRKVNARLIHSVVAL